MESVSGTSAPGQLGHEAILEATLRCLREDGYDATTIRRIAKQLNCAIGSIYRYFKDKRHLLLAVTQRLLEPVAVELENGGTFEVSVDRFVELAKADGEPYRLMFWLSCGTELQLPDVTTRVIDAWTAHLGDAALARQCWAMMHGAIIAGMASTDIRTAVIDMAGHQPQSTSMAQIVTLLKQPPKRLTPATSAPAMTGPSLASLTTPMPASAADHADAPATPVQALQQPAADEPSRRASQHRAGDTDDVCLL